MLRWRRTFVSEFSLHDFALLVFKPSIMLELALVAILLFLEVSTNFFKFLFLQHFFNFSPHSTQFLKLVHLKAIEFRVCWEFRNQAQAVVFLES